MTVSTERIGAPPSPRRAHGFTTPVVVRTPGGDTLLTIEVLGDARTTTVHVRGEVCLQTAPLLRTQLARLAGGERDIAVDVSDVSLLAAAGAHVLADAKRRCRAAGGRLDIVGSPPATVQMVLEIAGLLP